MSERIEARIARIVDGDTLILNVGWDHGVREGMRFAVVDPVEDVDDPLSNESLGAWEQVKAHLVVEHAQAKLSTCHARGADVARAASAVAAGTNVLSAQMIRDSMPAGSGREERVEVDRAQLSGRPKTGPVRVGDLARSIPD